MKTIARRILVGAGLLVLLQCSGDKPKPESQTGNPTLGGSQGLMNFRQLRAAWAAATGVDPYSLPVAVAFEENEGRLLSTNAPDQLTQPVVTASIALGAAFCHTLVDREAKADPTERRFFGQLALDKAPEDAGLRDAATKLTSALWRRPLRAEEEAELIQLGKDIYQMGLAKPGKTPALASQEAWLALCSAAGASLDALTL